MTIDAFINWIALASFLAGVGITMSVFQIPFTIRSARHIYLHLTKRPHDCERVIPGPYHF